MKMINTKNNLKVINTPEIDVKRNNRQEKECPENTQHTNQMKVSCLGLQALHLE